MADAYHLLPLASISVDLVTPADIGYIPYHWKDRLNLLNRINLEKKQKNPKPLQTVSYLYTTTFCANTLCPQMHRWNLSFKVIGTKKGKWESVKQISPINFTKNACEILHTEYMLLLLEI